MISLVPIHFFLIITPASLAISTAEPNLAIPLFFDKNLLSLKKPSVFHPANFNQYWLDTNRIIPGSSLDKGSSFTPLFVQAASDNMVLIITPDQILFDVCLHIN